MKNDLACWNKHSAVPAVRFSLRFDLLGLRRYRDLLPACILYNGLLEVHADSGKGKLFRVEVADV